MYDIAIIGAGVTGAAIARELSKYDFRIIVLDRENDISCGTSKANSAIIHAGYDAEENTLMAKLNVEGNAMFDRLCEELDVPFRRNGSLVVAFDDEQLVHIKKLMQRGINNGVPALSILSQEELLKREPALNPEAKGALLAESAGIIDPMLLTISMMESAVKNGVHYRLNFDIESIKNKGGVYILESGGDEIEAKYVINAAGVFADKVHNMAAKPSFKIKPRRGQYFLLDKIDGNIVNSVVFPCPTKMGKGTLVTPTVHTNLLIGPSSDDLDDPEDLSTTDELLEKARIGATLLVPKLTTRNSIRTFAGLRAEPDAGDFIIREAEGAPGFFDAAGIKSPGLTAAPAVALYMVEIMKKSGIAFTAKKNFNPLVKRKLFIDMSESAQSALIRGNPLYGRIICRCENITEGDIVDSIRRSPGATTVDGVKRRCRAGMGRCQGGFCGPRVQEIISRELNKPLEEVVLEKKHSYILTGKTK